MNVNDISVGDIVVFRQWDDMKKEFGLDDFGNIACKHTFVASMRKLCGMECMVTDVDQLYNRVYLTSVSGTYTPNNHYSISSDMLMPLCEVPFFDSSGFSDLVMNFEATP